MKAQILDKTRWLKIRSGLKNSYTPGADWNDTIDMFKKRIEDYFLIPIEKIINSSKLKGEGFTILTIQCNLIEMFAAFKQKKIYNFQKKNGGLKYEYRIANECFIKFLHSELIFENHFYQFDNTTNQRVLDRPFKAADFYEKIRCGLIHECRRLLGRKLDHLYDIPKDGSYDWWQDK